MQDLSASGHAPGGTLARPGAAPRPARALRRLPRVRRGDAIALTVLVVLPLLVFGVPGLLGHAVVPGDDLTQNYPLRVLAGQQLAAGHLPVFDPYIWSGAPLLGGWNAGAAYPLTLLFAVLHPVAAWSLNLAVTYAVAGAGTYWFCRALRLGPVAAFLGGLTFAFAGAMPAQAGHLGLVAGMSWLPVQLLAVLKLTRPPAPSSRLGAAGSRLAWIAVLAVSFGLTILAGEPRAICSAAVVLALYGGWRIAAAGRDGGWRRALAAAWPVAAGLILGVCLGAVQLLPGLAAIATSQRAAGSYGLYSSGSLPARWLTLMLVPDLLGGSGSFGQPAYFTHYTLAEITGYAGILPVAAALALLGRLRRGRPVPPWLGWHVIAAAGIVLALGSFSPAGHLLARIPLLGSQRLQSRNIVITDFALAVLLAYWADNPAGTLRRVAAARWWRPPAATVLGLLAPAGVLVLAALAIWQRAALLSWLGVTPGEIAGAGSLAGSVAPFAVLAAVAIAVILAAPRLPGRRPAGIIAALAVADVVLFSLMAVVAVQPPSPRATAARTSSAQQGLGQAAPPAALTPVTALGYPGRYAIYDPDLRGGTSLPVLGEPDLNVLTGTPSVQGYSSIVDGGYAKATGSHRATGDGQDVLSPRAISDGVLGQLDTSALLTRQAYLVTPGAGPAGGAGSRQAGAGQSATWYLGGRLAVTAVIVPDHGAGAGLQVGLVTPGGQTRWLPATATAGQPVTARAARPVTAVAVTVRAGGARVSLGPAVLTEAGGQQVTADGVLQNALTPPQWGFAGFDGSYAVFTDQHAAGPLTLRSLAGGPARDASARVLASQADVVSAAAVRSAAGVRVIRAVAGIPGWTATWHPATGPAVSLSVRADGVVQAVDVPAGQGVLTWAYSAPGLTAGLALSLAAAAILLLGILLAAWPGLARAAIVRFRRHGGRNSERAAAGLGHPAGVGDLPVAGLAAGPGDRRRPGRAHQHRD